jgi:hypothetical protein
MTGPSIRLGGLRDRLRIILVVPELVEGHPVIYNKIDFIRF